MQWIEIVAQADPGQTFAAEVAGGVLVRTVGPGETSALTLLPATTVGALTVSPTPPPATPVDPDSLDAESRALFDLIAAADPRVTELSPDQFDLVRIAVEASQ
jgi:hypothetical protein